MRSSNVADRSIPKWGSLLGLIIRLPDLEMLVRFLELERQIWQKAPPVATGPYQHRP